MLEVLKDGSAYAKKSPAKRLYYEQPENSDAPCKNGKLKLEFQPYFCTSNFNS